MKPFLTLNPSLSGEASAAVASTSEFPAVALRYSFTNSMI